MNSAGDWGGGQSSSVQFAKKNASAWNRTMVPRLSNTINLTGISLVLAMRANEQLWQPC